MRSKRKVEEQEEKKKENKREKKTREEFRLISTKFCKWVEVSHIVHENLINKRKFY